ncbi:MAG: hypothetical protein HWE39_04925 [Oceanospirillaceae bacterium]|nr:hypothetical protein [Oceanospirillaceae bacterium]
MPEIYRPRFSRRTLKVLLWLLPGLILLLASLGPDENSAPAIHQEPGRALYWLHQPDSPANQVRLLFATDIAITPDQLTAQQALAAELESRLSKTDRPVTVSPRTDRLEVSIRWPAGGEGPDLSALLDELAAPLAPAPLARQLQRLRARDYLESRSPDQLLLNSYRLNLLTTPVQDVSVQWLQARQTLLAEQVPLVLIGGPDADAFAARAAAALPAGMSREPVSAARLPPEPRLRLVLEDARQPAMRLLGGPAPGRDNAGYAAELIAFGSLQRLLDRQPGLQYRLLWQPLHRGGFRALILPASIGDPRALLREAEAPVGTAREQLEREYRSRLDSADGQLDLLADIAFYRLPDRRLDALADALQSAAKDDIAARMSHYLDPEPWIRIDLNDP